MYRYKCQDCGGKQYTSSSTATDKPCVYCGSPNVVLDGVGDSENLEPQGEPETGKMTARVILQFEPLKDGEQLCSVCKKRKATRLCDMPTRRACWAGHPPRDPGGVLKVGSGPMEYTVTCDRPICEKCAISMGGGIDFCPSCFQKIKTKTKTEVKK